MSNTYERTYNKRRNGICRSRTFVPIAILAVFGYAFSGSANATGAVQAISGAEAAYFIKVDSHADYRYRKVVKHGVVYYCRRETVTGSHLVKEQVCFTEKERKKLEDESQRQLRNLQNQALDPNINPNAGPGT